MNDHAPSSPPPHLAAIAAETARLGFAMACEDRTGSLLRTLAASKPGGRLLELGTGTGRSTAWLLAGMDRDARLVTVDDDPAVSAAAGAVLGGDPRLRFEVADGGPWLAAQRRDGASYDLVFADAWPGKYAHLDDALAVVAPGGLYVIDDMLPQPTWPEGHQARVDELLAILDARAELAVTRLTWASGLVIAVKRS